jgi:hypothetical protein
VQERLIDREVERLLDVEAAVAHLEHLATETVAAAGVAGHQQIGEEVHLDRDPAGPFALVAAPPRGVERERAVLETARQRGGLAGVDLAQRRVGAEVGDRTGARRLADRRLVDHHHPLDRVEPAHRAMRADGLRLLALEFLQRRAIQDLLHQAALARARDAGDRGEPPEREARGNVREIMVGGALDGDELLRRRRVARARHFLLAAQVGGGIGVDALERIAARPGVEQATTVLPGAGTEIDQVVGGAHQHRLVLDHHQRVPARRQLAEDLDQPVSVARMEADGRLVEHVQRVGEVRAQRVRQLDALRLAARQSAGRAVEREVAEVDALEERRTASPARPSPVPRSRARSRELEPAHERRGRGDRHRVDVGDRPAAR